jgi:rifampicin phosphotransferase
MSDWIVRGAGLLDATAVGNKFARLESMRRAGFPVPLLYCLPAAAFDEGTRGLAPMPPAPGTDAGADVIRQWSANAVALVRGVPLAADLSEQALSAFDEMIGVNGLAAVRACVVPAPGVPGEDDGADPFAGMSDSFLYVSRDMLLTRIVDCWASAFKPETVMYRMTRGAGVPAARVAVSVQRMALGTRSFVAFTRDPRDGSRRLVIAAAYGIGAGVVQEKADIDHFFVSADTGDVRATVTNKKMMLSGPDPSGGAEPGERLVPECLARRPVLDDGQTRRVVDMATRIEELFGCPQDIEGTFDDDDTLHVVQSRPMVLPSEPPAAPERMIQWSNHNITESYPGVSSTLTYSVARDFYRLIFADLYRRMGVPEHRLRRNAHHLERMIGMLDGRIYYRLDAWYALHGQMPAFEFVRGWWEHVMGLASGAGAAGPLRRGWQLRALLAAPALARGMTRHPAAVRDFLAWWDHTNRAATEKLDTKDTGELIAFYRRLWAQVGVRWGVTLTNTIFSFLIAATLDALLRRWAGQRDHALMLGLLSGGPCNRSLKALRSAIALAELINADEQARLRVLGAVTPDATRSVWTEFMSGECGTQIAAAASSYLREYGDRAPGDLKLENITPRQQPSMVLDIVRPFVCHGSTVAASLAAEQRTRKDAERQLRRACPGLARRAVLVLLAGALRWFTKAREDTRFCRTELFGLSRQVLLRLGGELASAGHLADAGDVIDLSVSEVLGAFEGTLAVSELKRLAAYRREERQRYLTLPEPPPRQDTATGSAFPVPVPRAPSADVGEFGGRLTGLASCAGVVRGRAVVVRDPLTSPESCRDAIIVARETDPGWLFLMTAAKGLVVERGTLLSHTAITGRLLGIPTVVSVANATSLIPDGSWVELNGTAGTVRILED